MSTPDSSTRPPALAGDLWAIRPDVYAELVAMAGAIASGAIASGAIEPASPEAARRSPMARAGGAVAVIPIQGVLTSRPSLIARLFGFDNSINGIRAMLRDAVADQQVGAVVLDVDSPGGSVDGIPEFAAEILQARKAKPVVAIANTVAASAAYWLASQASELFVSPSGRVGSIGVFMAHEDWSKFDERMGVATTLIAAGKYKVEGNPFEPLSDEAKEAMQAVVDDYYGMFVDAVAKGRGTTASKVRGGFGEGRMVLASHAKDEGMVDAVGTIEDAVRRAAALASGRGGATSAEDPTTPPAAGEPDPTPAIAPAADSHDLDVELIAASSSFRAALRGNP